MKYILPFLLALGCNLDLPELPDALQPVEQEPAICPAVARCMLSICDYQHNADPIRASGYVKGCATVCAAVNGGDHVAGTAANVFIECSTDGECVEALEACGEL